MKKTLWITIGILSVLIGLYPLAYFIIDTRFGLLLSKSNELLSDNLWNIGFYSHIIFGGLALLIGWIQFNDKLRIKRVELHKKIGKVYMISVLISGICSVYISFFATGGFISMLGFFSLGIIWLTSTGLGFKAIKKGDIQSHKKYMIFSYSACFAAVTLRIWLPLLTTLIGEFVGAYRVVAWLCWIPNLIVAYFIIRNQNVKNPVINSV